MGENGKLSDKWKKCFNSAFNSCEKIEEMTIDTIITRAEKIYNKPEFNPLCEKIRNQMAKNNYPLSDLFTEGLNKATNDIVEFPEMTDQMVDDVQEDVQQCKGYQYVINKLRDNCKIGKYSWKKLKD